MSILHYVLRCLPAVKAAAVPAVVGGTLAAAAVSTYAWRGVDGLWRNANGSLQQEARPRARRAPAIRQDGPRCFMVPVYSDDTYGLPPGPYVAPYDLATLSDYRLDGFGDQASMFSNSPLFPFVSAVGIPGLPPMVPVGPELPTPAGAPPTSVPPAIAPPVLPPVVLPPILPPNAPPSSGTERPVTVPEPPSLAMFVVGIVGLLVVARKIVT